MLVSLHLPKTAGTSFLTALESHFGATLSRDYDDRPLHCSSWQRRSAALLACARNAWRPEHAADIACVHGHFLPLKYRCLRTPVRPLFVTWMRDPIERLASHYYYWLSSYDPAQAGPLHRRVVQEQWSLEQFCFARELRNVYSEFLWCFPLRRFAFVGITEHYSTELESFSRLFLGGAEVAVADENRNAAKAPAGPGGTVHINDREFRKRIEAYHAADMQLYRAALGLREARISNA